MHAQGHVWRSQGSCQVDCVLLCGLRMNSGCRDLHSKCFTHCPVVLFCCCDKTLAKTGLRAGKGLRKAKAGTWRQVLSGTWAVGKASHWPAPCAVLTLLLATRTTCPAVALLHSGRALLYAFTNCPTLSCMPSDGGSF